MNDPHVEALIYTVVHSDTVDYEKAKPLEYDGLRFKARIEDGSARFEMKEHFATVEEARAVVDPATLAWEISVGLKLGPGEFSLKFDRPEIIDRGPVPGVVELSTAVSLSIRATAIIHLARGAYPSFPLDLAVDPDVESMYRRYQDFRDNREPLASMAYFCLTVITGWGPGQKKAAELLSVKSQVLRELGKLTSIVGGRYARKAAGQSREYTAAESSWIETAVKMLVYRAGEVCFDSNKALPEITITDLPQL